VNIRDRVAIVTGASSGIGAATALELARRGASVFAVARRAEKLAAVCGSACTALPGDVGRRDDCERVVAEARRQSGRPVDILVNNAGISPGEDSINDTVAGVERVMAINFMGPVYLTGAVLPDMVARRTGSIVNVTSVSGYVPNPGEPAYGASKAALSRWSHGLAVELAKHHVHVGVVSPGPIATEIWDSDTVAYSGKLYPPEMVAEAIAKMIERGHVHVTVPRRFGAVAAMYPLTGRPMRWGLRKYGASH
jgi:NAD(P)-dependent dehydrogenase (short-subunit alcohol dehydrogenase family)